VGGQREGRSEGKKGRERQRVDTIIFCYSYLLESTIVLIFMLADGFGMFAT